jgi:hypothetical protein
VLQSSAKGIHFSDEQFISDSLREKSNSVLQEMESTVDAPEVAMYFSVEP